MDIVDARQCEELDINRKGHIVEWSNRRFLHEFIVAPLLVHHQKKNTTK